MKFAQIAVGTKKILDKSNIFSLYHKLITYTLNQKKYERTELKN